MRVLLLSNSAPGYFRLFNALAQRFVSEGDEVRVAVDSEFSLDENRLRDLDIPIDLFSVFFRDYCDRPQSIDQWYRQRNLNVGLLSDYERAEWYGMTYGRQRTYYDKLKWALIAFFDEIVVKHQTQAVLYENVSNSFSYFCWLVCQRYGIVYCGIGSSRLPGRFSIVGDPFREYEQCQKIYNEVTCGQRSVPTEVKEWIIRYLEDFDKVVPDYMRFNKLDQVSIAKRYLRLEKMKKLWSVLRHWRKDHRYDFQVGNPANLSFRSVMRSIQRRARLGRVKALYETLYPGEAYVLYPLQLHPEASTSVLSPHYIDELDIVRNIAFSLPEGVRLVVKDHISAYGSPSISFYERVKSLPNVVLVSPFESTKQLIRGSLGVITVTSTVGYEAVILQKRVFVLGVVFYQFHPNVIRVKAFDQLHDLFVRYLWEPVSTDGVDTAAFVASYFMTTRPGTLNLTLADTESQCLAEEIYPHIRDYLVTHAES